MPRQLHLISWNVAGWTRSRYSILRHYKSIRSFLDRHRADIFCIQEVKMSKQKIVENGRVMDAFLQGWETFWCPCVDTPNFNGVATFARSGLTLRANASPLEPRELNDHGRCISTEHEHFVLFNVYCPAESNKLGTSFKIRFLGALRRAMRQASADTGKPVILCGDINIAAHPEDSHWLWRRICVDDMVLAQGEGGYVPAPLPTDSRFLRLPRDRARYLRCQEQVATHWQTIQRLLAKRVIVSEVTRNSATQQAYDRFRVVVPVGPRRVKLGKPFHTEECAMRAYRLDGYVMASEDEPHEQDELQDADGDRAPRYAYPPNCTSVDTLAELLKSLVNVTWDQQTQMLVSNVLGESHSSIPCNEWLLNLLSRDKMVDTFRKFFPRTRYWNRFTCWNQYTNGRYSNYGTRIDYILVDPELDACVRKGPVGLYCEDMGESASRRPSPNKLSPPATHATNTESIPNNDAPPESVRTALAAATGKFQYSAASFDGSGLVHAPQSVIDEQFREPHTGIIYTPPKYSDHVGVATVLEFDQVSDMMLSEDADTRAAQIHKKQQSIKSFFALGRTRPVAQPNPTPKPAPPTQVRHHSATRSSPAQSRPKPTAPQTKLGGNTKKRKKEESAPPNKSSITSYFQRK